MTLAPGGGPVAAEDEGFGVDGAAVEVSDLGGVRGVGDVHDGDASLIPGLDLDVLSCDRYKRIVVREHFIVTSLRSRVCSSFHT